MAGIAKLTPRTCGEAIERWMLATWRSRPTTIEFAEVDDRFWIELRGFVPADVPEGEPDESVVRVLLPGRAVSSIDQPMTATLAIVRLYQRDPTPREMVSTWRGQEVRQVVRPQLPETLALFGTRDGVVAADCDVAPDDFGHSVRRPFAD